MKNLKIFYSGNKEYIISFLTFMIILGLVSFVFSQNLGVFLYTLILVFFILFVLGLIRYVKLKKILENNKFSYFRNDLYEKQVGEIICKNNNKLQDIELKRRKSQDDLERLLTLWTHQIKTPISAISLISARYDIKDIDLELIRIDDYISSLISFIKSRKDSLDYNFKSFSIEILIKDIVKRYRRFFIEKRLSLKLDIENNLIVSDSKWLGFVIEQILFNSIKYTKKGSITIRYKENILQIIDTGIGIKNEDLENIKKFGYSGDTYKRDANSTGIGLFLVDEILTKLGYSYKIDSKVNEGTTFSINLKRNDLIRD